jgi:hypothetical protein
VTQKLPTMPATVAPLVYTVPVQRGRHLGHGHRSAANLAKSVTAE